MLERIYSVAVRDSDRGVKSEEQAKFLTFYFYLSLYAAVRGYFGGEGAPSGSLVSCSGGSFQPARSSKAMP
jgi:hypothetical protein